MDDEELSPPGAPDMAWLLTFADLVSLMLTFFILLYSMKVIDARKWEGLRGALDDTFSIQEPLVETRPDQTSTVEKIDPLKADNLQYIESILHTRFRDDPVLSATGVKRSPDLGRLILSMPSTLLFAPGSDVLKEEGANALGLLGDVVRHLDNKIEIAGHTDPAPISSGKFPSNWELAMMRALKVVFILKEQGIETAIPAMSYGASRFYQIDPDLNKIERYSRARRVDIIVHGDK